MKKLLRKRILIPLVLFLAIILGPRASFDPIDPTPIELNIGLTDLDEYISRKESKVEKLKSANNARIVWADSVRKTPYSLVFLHGFLAGPMEGDPVHFNFAKRYGCNMYLARLAQHGLDDRDAMLSLTPKDWVESAKEAIAIGKTLGEKVIVMGSSTGCTLALYLAAHQPDDIHGLICYSPNIATYRQIARVSLMPWGARLSKLINGGDYRQVGHTQEIHWKYWNKEYHIEGIAPLISLLDQTMIKETFSKIQQPIFFGYYYKNEEEQDKVVSIEAMKEAFDYIATDLEKKRLIAFPNAGHHVLVSKHKSLELKTVEEETFSFAEKILGLRPSPNH